MLEKLTIVINEKEYNFLKPYACDLIDIEDQSFEKGVFKAYKFNKLILGLVSQKINIGDLVEFTNPEITLSSGDVLTVEDMGYDKYQEVLQNISKKTRVGFCKEFLKASGIEGKVDLKSFSYDDINVCADAFVGIYDDSKLLEVVDSVSGFCLSSEEK